MLMPSIARYMTRQPLTIESSTSLGDAQILMNEQDVRHLPVVENGRLVGIVSDRDLRLAASLGESRSTRIREVMTEPVYAVNAAEPVDKVARAMSERRVGSAVVVTNDGAIEGIFTMVDACRALSEVLERAVA